MRSDEWSKRWTHQNSGLLLTGPVKNLSRAKHVLSMVEENVKESFFESDFLSPRRKGAKRQGRPWSRAKRGSYERFLPLVEMTSIFHFFRTSRLCALARDFF